MVQQWPMPLDISIFYDEYPIHQKKSWIHQFLRRQVMKNVYFNTKQLQPYSKLLDYGCGDGWFLQENLNRGHQLLGFEPNEQHSRRLSKEMGISVLSDKKELIEKHAGSIDCVTMNFVLEHLPDPHAVFQDVARLLKPGGIFYCVIPHFDSFEQKIFKKKWHSLDPPRHLIFPNFKGMDLMSKSAGFQHCDQKFVPFPNGFAGSLPVVFTGQFSFIGFVLSLPLGILFSHFIASGAAAYTFIGKD